ncbi:MAG: hypothetical protein D6725_15090, partial [Planctomycetota bacterium]
MQHNLWKLVALCGVVGIGVLIVVQTHRAIRTESPSDAEQIVQNAVGPVADEGEADQSAAPTASGLQGGLDPRSPLPDFAAVPGETGSAEPPGISGSDGAPGVTHGADAPAPPGGQVEPPPFAEPTRDGFGEASADGRGILATEADAPAAAEEMPFESPGDTPPTGARETASVADEPSDGRLPPLPLPEPAADSTAEPATPEATPDRFDPLLAEAARTANPGRALELRGEAVDQPHASNSEATPPQGTDARPQSGVAVPVPAEDPFATPAESARSASN